MTVQELRTTLDPVLLICQIVASYTKTSRDDQAVALAQKILHNDEIAQAIVDLLSKAPPEVVT